MIKNKSVTGGAIERPTTPTGREAVGGPEKIFSQKGASMEQWELEREAAGRVVPWGKPEKGDYDFSSWTCEAGQDLLKAGCVYENAREAWKLRCLLVLINARLEKVRGLEFLWLSFERLRYGDAVQQLGGWFGWLRSFTGELACNTPFADLEEKRVRESLATRPRYFLAPKAVGLAMPEGLIEPSVLWPGQLAPQDAPGRRINRVENIAIQVRWRDFTNDQIGKEMVKLAALHRPPECPEPVRKGKGKKSEIESLLDALSVMRITKLHEHNQWKRLALVEEVCGYSGCKKEKRAYKERCKSGRGDEAMNNGAQVEMNRARDRALAFFQQLFPGEMPSNW